MRILAFLAAVYLVCVPACAQMAPADVVTAIQDRISHSDLDGARARLHTAIRRYPTDGGLYNLQGILAAQGNDYAAAEKAFRNAVRLSPGLTGAWLNLGRLYQMNAHSHPPAVEKGIAVYRHLLTAQPDLPEANYQLALLLQLQGAFRQSMAHLDRLPPQDQSRTSAVLLRCVDQAGAGDVTAAAATARIALERADLAESDVLAVLPTLLNAKCNDVARVLLEGLRSKNQASKESVAHLAAISEQAGDFAEARQLFETVAQESPNQIPPLLDLARVAWKQKDYEGTLGYLAHARDLDPKNPGIHFFFGLACNELHLAVEARKSMAKAIELAPDNPYYNYAMGALQLQWADTQAAVPYLKKYIAAKSDDARGHLALATAYFLRNEFDEARHEADIVAADPALKPTAEFLLGRIARESGDYDEAEQHFLAALRLSPKIPGAHAELAVILFDKEDYAGARRETELALEQDPDSYAANRVLLLLYSRAKDPRAKSQAERLTALVEKRNKKMDLMLRSIEVRP